MITKDVGAFKAAEADTSEAGDLPAETQNSTMEIVTIFIMRLIT